MAHRLEKSSISILSPLKSGDTYWSVFLICPPTPPHSHAPTHTTQLSSNSIGTFYLSQGTAWKKEFLWEVFGKGEWAQQWETLTSHHPLGAKPKTWMTIDWTPANQPILPEPPPLYNLTQLWLQRGRPRCSPRQSCNKPAIRLSPWLFLQSEGLRWALIKSDMVM